MRKSDVLVVMARYPTPGKVKTRLARVLGADQACDLYRAFLIDIAHRFSGRSYEVIWAVDPPGTQIGEVIGANAGAIFQRGPDLAARMLDAFEQCFASGARRVVMIGADAPHLSIEAVDEAFARLDRCDAVIVPTRDGGYCLIAMKARHDLFTRIEMGSARVFDETLRRADALRLEVHRMAETFDIDVIEDLELLRGLLEDPTQDLSATRAVLQNVGEGAGTK